VRVALDQVEGRSSCGRQEGNAPPSTGQERGAQWQRVVAAAYGEQNQAEQTCEQRAEHERGAESLHRGSRQLPRRR